MKILAFDTANSNNDVAILNDGAILAQNSGEISSSQAEMLIPMIEKSLKSANIWYQDLDLIVTTKGPGNFTGIRIGFSVAKVIKAVTNIPLVALNNLEVLAYDYISDYEGNILVVLDAKLEEFFIQEFVISAKNLIPKYVDPKLIKQEEIDDYLPESEFLIIGSGKEIAQKIITRKDFKISEKADIIQAKNLALLAIENYKKDQKDFDEEILYVRQPIITKPREPKCF